MLFFSTMATLFYILYQQCTAVPIYLEPFQHFSISSPKVFYFQSFSSFFFFLIIAILMIIKEYQWFFICSPLRIGDIKYLFMSFLEFC
jgi:hypothetical protein